MLALSHVQVPHKRTMVATRGTVLQRRGEIVRTTALVTRLV